MSIRIGLIGAGIMGADHARIIADEVPGVTIQVVCDASANRAREVADQCGAVDAVTDPLAAIARADVDALLIASPDETHLPLCKAAISARKPTLCEKPLARTAADCLAIMKAEQACGKRTIQVGFMRRFDPSYREMKATLDAGTLGTAIMMHNAHRAVSAPASFTGQMSITNAAPHEFDIARHVLGAEFTSVTAFQAGSTIQSNGPVMILLQGDHGVLVSIEVNVNAGYGYDIRAELVGTRGSIELDAPRQSRINAELGARTGYPADWRPRFAEAYRRQAQDWIRSIRRGLTSEIGASAWDGYSAARLAEAAGQSLREGRSIRLAPVPRPAFYDTTTG